MFHKKNLVADSFMKRLRQLHLDHAEMTKKVGLYLIKIYLLADSCMKRLRHVDFGLDVDQVVMKGLNLNMVECRTEHFHDPIPRSGLDGVFFVIVLQPCWK